MVACDISAAMLAEAAARSADPQSAPIEYHQCPATAIGVDDDGFDAVLCQQGLQFFGDPPAAVREMVRAARPDGVVAASVWAAEYPLGLFGAVNETLRAVGLTEPYPRAFDSASYQVSDAELAELFGAAGLRDVRVEAVELDAVWASAQEVTSAVFGMPFGAMVAAQPADTRRQVHDGIAERALRAGTPSRANNARHAVSAR